jgi:coenzyme F420-reducing hydrogenase alpha subunit
VNGRGAYLTGPLARYNLDYGRLSPGARAAAEAIGFLPPCHNPFKTILVRGLEVIHAFETAAEIVRGYTPPEHPFVEIPERAGTGHGATEAPRGLLYHRYSVDDRGLITDAKIVPPTSQNQRSIEEDLFDLAPALAEMPHADATRRAEQAIRNHDPCISCATHFLTLRVERDA